MAATRFLLLDFLATILTSFGSHVPLFYVREEGGLLTEPRARIFI